MEQYADLSFRFLESQWGQGYALESALACQNWARERGVPNLVLRIREDHQRSLNIARKMKAQFKYAYKESGKKVHLFTLS